MGFAARGFRKNQSLLTSATDLTLTGQVLGSPNYLPPEQAEARHQDIGPASDVYALGATLHHLLTNTDPRLETPFTFQERPIRQLNQSVSPEMEAVARLGGGVGSRRARSAPGARPDRRGQGGPVAAGPRSS